MEKIGWQKDKENNSADTIPAKDKYKYFDKNYIDTIISILEKAREKILKI